MIKPEYTLVTDLYLVYPKGFNEIADNIINFYKNLIGLIPENIRQFIIVNNDEAANEIKDLYPSKKIEPIIIKEFNEIWLRDILGFNSGTNKIYKPIYNPDYCNYIYPECYLNTIDKQVREIFYKTTNPEIIEVPLILDGGNLVTNGDIGFITDKILIQNKNNPNINQILKDLMGIKAIVVESNVNDKLSHSDGYMAFLSQKQICISRYPQIAFLADDIKYLNVLNQVIDSFPLEKINIYDRPVDEKVIGGGQTENDRSKDCLSSARGSYINFLILNDTIILPEYTIPNYKKSMDHNTVNKRTLTNLGYKVITINCDDLSKLGGSLHCISFTN